MGARGPCPALLTSTSIRPHFAMAPSTRRFKSSFDLFEPVTPSPPSSAASASPLPEDDRIATRNPSAASRRAAPAPMPLPPAVTSATFSAAMTDHPFELRRATGSAYHEGFYSQTCRQVHGRRSQS